MDTDTGMWQILGACSVLLLLAHAWQVFVGNSRALNAVFATIGAAIAGTLVLSGHTIAFVVLATFIAVGVFAFKRLLALEMRKNPPPRGSTPRTFLWFLAVKALVLCAMFVYLWHIV